MQNCKELILRIGRLISVCLHFLLNNFRYVSICVSHTFLSVFSKEGYFIYNINITASKLFCFHTESYL